MHTYLAPKSSCTCVSADCTHQPHPCLYSNHQQPVSAPVRLAAPATGQEPHTRGEDSEQSNGNTYRMCQHTIWQKSPPDDTHTVHTRGLDSMPIQKPKPTTLSPKTRHHCSSNRASLQVWELPAHHTHVLNPPNTLSPPSLGTTPSQRHPKGKQGPASTRWQPQVLYKQSDGYKPCCTRGSRERDQPKAHSNKQAATATLVPCTCIRQAETVCRQMCLSKQGRNPA